MSASEYAAAHGICAGTLAWWASRLAVQARATESKTVASRPTEPSAFLPVRVVDESERGLKGSTPQTFVQRERPELTFEIVLVNGITVRVGDGFDERTLTRLLEVVERAVRC
jgi:hypothetical protein